MWDIYLRSPEDDLKDLFEEFAPVVPVTIPAEAPTELFTAAVPDVSTSLPTDVSNAFYVTAPATVYPAAPAAVSSGFPGDVFVGSPDIAHFPDGASADYPRGVSAGHHRGVFAGYRGAVSNGFLTGYPAAVPAGMRAADLPNDPEYLRFRTLLAFHEGLIDEYGRPTHAANVYSAPGATTIVSPSSASRRMYHDGEIQTVNPAALDLNNSFDELEEFNTSNDDNSTYLFNEFKNACDSLPEAQGAPVPDLTGENAPNVDAAGTSMPASSNTHGFDDYPAAVEAIQPAYVTGPANATMHSRNSERARACAHAHGPASVSTPAAKSVVPVLEVPTTIDAWYARADAMQHGDTTWFSLEQAREAFLSRDAPLEDETLPKNVAEKRMLVWYLCKSLVSTDRALDSETVLRPFQEGRIPKEVVELTAWELVVNDANYLLWKASWLTYHRRG